jgi:hypothetical protein
MALQIGAYMQSTGIDSISAAVRTLLEVGLAQVNGGNDLPETFRRAAYREGLFAAMGSIKKRLESMFVEASNDFEGA